MFSFFAILRYHRILLLLLLLLFFKSSACSIAVSNITRYCNHTILLLVFIYIFSLGWFIFTKSIEFMYLTNCFRFLLVSSLLPTGQLPTLSTLVFRRSLSFFSLLHWNIRWSIVWMPWLLLLLLLLLLSSSSSSHWSTHKMYP